jgi:thiol-disulfide isomerase/thioredoxin
MIGVLVAVAVVVVTTLFGLVWRARDGRLRTVAVTGTAAATGETRVGEAAVADGFQWDDLGADLGERATLVQFSTAFCAPCRATRRVLGEIADTVDGVAHIEIDAEARLDLTRRLNILRTPTVFVLDSGGRIVRRASGRPRKADVIAALGEAVL